jgi:hypothetical protein
MAVKKPVDWDQVAIDIRAGILTDRQIGEKHGRSHGAIHQYAKKNNIERNLTARIRERTETKLSKAALSKKTIQERAKLTQEQTIEIAAEVQATIVIKQQGRIGRHLSVSEALIAELESQTIDRELYEKLGELMESPDENGNDKLNDLYRKVISTSSRIDSHKKAVETERVLIALERQAFGLKDDAEDSKKPLDESAIDERLALLLAK